MEAGKEDDDDIESEILRLEITEGEEEMALVEMRVQLKTERAGAATPCDRGSPRKRHVQVVRMMTTTRRCTQRGNDARRTISLVRQVHSFPLTPLTSMCHGREALATWRHQPLQVQGAHH